MACVDRRRCIAWRWDRTASWWRQPVIRLMGIRNTFFEEELAVPCVTICTQGIPSIATHSRRCDDSTLHGDQGTSRYLSNDAFTAVLALAHSPKARRRQPVSSHQRPMVSSQSISQLALLSKQAHQ